MSGLTLFKKIVLITGVLAVGLPPVLSYAWWDDDRDYPRHHFDNGPYYRSYDGPYYVPVETRYVVVDQPQYVEVAPEPNQTKVAEGSVMGGILGALTGGIIGHQMKGHHDLGGALLGGVAGATIGGIAGAQIPNDDPRLVARPVAVPVAPKPVAEMFTVAVPNTQGGYTQVLIRRAGSGYVGPQGEYYSEFPKVDQLSVMYAK